LLHGAAAEPDYSSFLNDPVLGNDPLLTGKVNPW
jgi:hypothetical protein